ncbi:Hsp20/alpha crystallin family protein [Akkermansiaceae bacterium]|nr:Hsp20/alpha crystallin family protein [Akkermansiaceae bacterium]
MSTLTTWNPYQELERLQDRVIRAMRLSPTHSDGEGNSLLTHSDWSPAVDITEDDKEYLITADLPQVDKDDVKVVVENGSLIIRGERNREKVHSERKVHRIERSYGSFQRSFSLPEDADGNGVTASFRDGALRVSLPKSEEKKPKHIEVRVD